MRGNALQRKIAIESLAAWHSFFCREKIIKNVSINAQTKQYEKSLDGMLAAVVQHGGYEELKACVGPPLTESFKRYGMPDDELFNAAMFYRDYYRETGVMQYSVYDGVEEMLKALKNAGKKVFCATSKPTPFAVEALEKAGLLQYLDEVFGAEFDEKLPKEFIVKAAVEGCGATDVSQILMIGDTKYDIIAAKKNSLECAAVRYGFGNDEDFKLHGAAYIFDTPQAVTDFILNI